MHTQGIHLLRKSRRLWALSALSICLSVLTLMRSASTDAAAVEVEAEDAPIPITSVDDNVLIATAVSMSNGDDSALQLEEGVPVVIHYLDADITATAEDETVSKLLDRLKIEPSPLDMVAVDSSAEPVEITIGTQFVYYDTVEEITESPVRYVDNSILPTWSEQVITQGQDGVHRKVYEVVYENGQEISRHLVESVDTEPTETVIERGTLENFAPNDAEVVDIITNADGSGKLVLANGQEVTFSKTMTMRATAYTTGDPGVGTITASGSTVHLGTVGVDRSQLPFGTKMYIVSNDGAYTYGFSIAEDTGGAIRKNRIDLYYYTYEECIQFGVRDCTVYILD